MKVLIVAGGQGTRLWPVSRKHKPKQLLKFIDNKTLLEQTFARIRKGFHPSDIFVATGETYSSNIKKQLSEVPENHYILEPVMRDRGTAVLAGLLLIDHFFPGSSVVLSWSDHYIKKEVAYLKTLRDAEKLLGKDPNQIIGIGVKPPYPRMGFDYLEVGKKLKEKVEAYELQTVKIRGDIKTVTGYVKSGKCFWNTGYWASTTTYLLSEYQRLEPEAFKIAMKLRGSLGTGKQQNALDSHYPKFPVIELEKNIMMNASKRTLLIGKFDWMDVGSWRVVKDALSKPKDNVVQGDAVQIDTEGSLIYNNAEMLVATIGLKDVVIINTDDAILIADKQSSEERIREIIAKIKKEKKYHKYL